MYLHRVDLENYRGIRKAEVDLAEMTVFIGENGCGKSSLLNAIETCIGRKAPAGSFDFRPGDLYLNGDDNPSREIRLQLHFREIELSSAALLTPLREAGLTDSQGLLNFQLQVTASPQANGFSVDWRLGQEQRWLTDEGLLGLLRRACPLVRIRCGRLPEIAISEEDDSASPMLNQIRQAFHSIMESQAPPPGLLESALAHLKEFIAGLDSHRTAREPASLVGRLEAPMKGPDDFRWVVRHLRGTGIQSLAILAVMSDFVEAQGPGPLSEDSTPIITLEEPEVHLHPLASRTVWNLLEPLSAQKLLTTYSPELLAAAPLSTVRRMIRSHDGHLSLFGPSPQQFDRRSLRRAAYHVRIRRSSALFMRAWLLVEGESEFWLLNEVARVCGYDLASEGVTCVEFAQSGLGVLVELAASLGIKWHILCDGDKAGNQYREEAERLLHLGGGEIFQLRELDLENCLWNHGYESIYRREAGAIKRARKAGRKVVLKQAVRKTSKPYLALAVSEEMRSRGERGAPRPLRTLIENVVRAARSLDN